MNKRAIAVIIAGFFTVSIAYSIRYGYGMLLPEMLLELDFTKIQAGGILTVYFIIYTIFTPALGALSDHYSYSAILTIFTAILGLGALLMATTTGFIQTNLFFSVAAFGHAACWAPVVVLVQKWVPDSRRGTALSFVSMGVGTGIFVWGIVLPLFVSNYGWRSGWMALGITGLVIALLNLILVRNPPVPNIKENKSKFNISLFLAAYRDIFARKSFWIIGTAYLLVSFNVIIIFTFLPVYSRESLDMAFAVSTRFISIIAFFGICGQLTLGPLSDKVGRIRIMIICGIIAGFGCLAIIYASDLWLLYAVVGCYGVGYGAIWPVYAAAATDQFSRRHAGGVIGLWTIFLGVGSLIAPVISGWIIDSTGSYTGVFLSAMAAGLLSAIILLAIPKPVPTE